MKNEAMVKEILTYLGGKENLDFVNHCATRLRVKVKDISQVEQEKIKVMKGVMGLIVQNNEVHVVIGTNVNEVYNDFLDVSGTDNREANDKDDIVPKEKLTIKGAFNTAIDFCSGIFTPILPILVAAGLIAAVVNIAVNFFGMDASGGTATIFNAINSSGFYFLPIYLGFTAARKLKINPCMGAFLGAILVSGAINGVEGLSFLGISVYTASYNGTCLPVIFGVLLMAFVDKKIDKFMPRGLKFFMKPLLTMIIVVPITVIWLGPIGAFLSNYVAAGIVWLYSKVGFLTVGILGFFNPLMVMAGLDKALVSIILDSLSKQGFETILLPEALTSNTAVGGAALAVWFMSKNPDTKALGLSAGLTGVLGITEPSLFGICLKFKKPLLGAMIGGGIGGLFAGIMGIKGYALVSPGLAATPTYISPNGEMTNFYLTLVAIIISITASFIATIWLSRKDKIMYN